MTLIFPIFPTALVFPAALRGRASPGPLHQHDGSKLSVNYHDFKKHTVKILSIGADLSAVGAASGAAIQCQPPLFTNDPDGHT